MKVITFIFILSFIEVSLKNVKLGNELIFYSFNFIVGFYVKIIIIQSRYIINNIVVFNI